MRKALYWLSKESAWTLRESDTQFIVTIENKKAAQELHALVNDFQLRERLDDITGNARLLAVNAALERIAK